VSAQALVCTSCGASLEPKVLESRVKCSYCETVFTLVRDPEGIRGLSPEGAAPPATNASSPAAPSTGLDPQMIARIERDAALVVRGLEAVEETAFAARGVARVGTCGCLGAVVLGLSIAGAALVLGGS
jgi:hypothetical protein